MKSISEIKPYQKNPRKNDGKAVEKVAMSIQEYGFNQPIVIDKDNVIIAGHTRYKAAKKLGMKEVPFIQVDLPDEKANAYRIADNRVAQESEWDFDLLKIELGDLNLANIDLGLTGFDMSELDDLLAESVSSLGAEDDELTLEVKKEAISKLGDVWILGDHRVMCGDSTDVKHVETLLDNQSPALLHADPPYGMGKEKDGVLNDNLRNADLDQFQMSWFTSIYPHLIKNVSIYIWGNAKDLWRLWFKSGLSDIEGLNLQQEIVWAKIRSEGSEKFDAIGQSSSEMKVYPIASERCLFLTMGVDKRDNNSNNYWEGWEPIRSYLENEVKKMKWSQKKVHEITGTQMHSRWFSKSQWTFINNKEYLMLKDEAGGHALNRDYSELREEYLSAKKIYDGDSSSFLFESSHYFDNTHDNMSDVWTSMRVKGNDRHGHATPKPLELMERIVKTSSKKGDLVYEPFGGSGSTLIACEGLGRSCCTMELSPNYVDTIIRRWENKTKKKAILESTGEEFNDI